VNSVKDLLAVAGAPIGPPLAVTDFLNRWGCLGNELATILTLRNGFYAYESSLLLRPFNNESLPVGLLEWNQPDLWRAKYNENLGQVLFFAEDVFGCQFCIREGSIYTFDPETGNFEKIAASFQEWAQILIDDYEFRTGYPLSHAWQMQNGPLPNGMRLLPKIPFVCSGKYDVKNLHSLSDVKGMRFRASIANQIRSVPNGMEIVFKLDNDDTPER
jgi:hypothetical protein